MERWMIGDVGWTGYDGKWEDDGMGNRFLSWDASSFFGGWRGTPLSFHYGIWIEAVGMAIWIYSPTRWVGDWFLCCMNGRSCVIDCEGGFVTLMVYEDWWDWFVDGDRCCLCWMVEIYIWGGEIYIYICWGGRGCGYAWECRALWDRWHVVWNQDCLRFLNDGVLSVWLGEMNGIEKGLSLV